MLGSVTESVPSRACAGIATSDHPDLLPAGLGDAR
jgi:hypothetical protein